MYMFSLSAMFNTATGTLKILFSGGVFPIEFFVEIGDDFYCLRLKIVRGRQAVVYHKNGRIGKPFFEVRIIYVFDIVFCRFIVQV